MNWLINPDELSLREELGRGSFGVVRRAQWRHTQVAVKVLYDDAQAEDKELFEREVKMMATLHHPNIVQFLGFARTPKLTLVIELFPEGSVEQFVPNEKPSHKTCLRVCFEMALAVEYLHSRRPVVVIHRDIKPANFLLTASRRVKLGDFGIARNPSSRRKEESSMPKNYSYGSVGSLELMSDASNHGSNGALTELNNDPRCVSESPSDSMLLTSNCGTARYMAPEVAAQGGEKTSSYTCAADVFSLAMVYYFVFERVPPSIPGHSTPATYLQALYENKRAAFHRTPKPMRDLITAMWHIDAKERPNAATILDFLNGLKTTSTMIGDGKISYA